MRNIDKLPHHKQMAVVYEISGYSRGKIADSLEVTVDTVTNWRKDPTYQAAIQEERALLREKLIDDYASSIKVTLDGLGHEMVKRVQEDDLRVVPFDKLTKSFNTLWQLVNQTGKDAVKTSKDGSDKAEEVDVLSDIKKRLMQSPTGREYLEGNGEK